MSEYWNIKFQNLSCLNIKIAHFNIETEYFKIDAKDLNTEI